MDERRQRQRPDALRKPAEERAAVEAGLNLLGIGRKGHKAPNTYIQVPEKFQTPNSASTASPPIRAKYVFTVGPAHVPRVVCSVPSRRLDAVVDVVLDDGSAWIPKSRQGRPKVAHGFNRGLGLESRQSPSGAKEEIGLRRRVLSSLTGLVLYSRHDPAMNRWAIFERPFGTWNHDTVNGSPGEAGGLRK